MAWLEPRDAEAGSRLTGLLGGPLADVARGRSDARGPGQPPELEKDRGSGHESGPRPSGRSAEKGKSPLAMNAVRADDDDRDRRIAAALADANADRDVRPADLRRPSSKRLEVLGWGGG
jgi:hypothetical protein